MGKGAEKALQPPAAPSEAQPAGGDADSDAGSEISMDETGLDEIDAKHLRQDEDKDGSSSAGTPPLGTGGCGWWRIGCGVQINSSRSQSVCVGRG